MDNLQVDLIDMTKQSGGYIMNAVDVFSRKAESVKLNNKSKESVKKGLEQIFAKFGQKPKKIQSDKEPALYALEDELNKQGIILYTVKNAFDYGNSAPIVERFNRTMRDFMNVERDRKQYINKHALTNYVVKTFPNIYNNNVHSTVKQKPNDIANRNIDPDIIFSEQMNRASKPKQEPKEIYKVGDKIYLVKPPPPGIEKKDALKWYKEPFEIEEVFNTNPTTYKIKGKTEKYYKKTNEKGLKTKNYYLL